MGFVDPSTVVSPKARWELEKIIINTGQAGWSAASGNWDGDSVIGIRWNGSDKEEGNGNPQSRGHPTWFIVPGELEEVLLREIERINKVGGLVSCRIYQPKGYEFGAWKIEATLSQQLLDKLMGCELTFSLPKLKHRGCHSDEGFNKFEDNELQGRFVDGKWKGHLYSNGISEIENPTTIEMVRDELIENVLEKFEKNPNSKGKC